MTRYGLTTFRAPFFIVGCPRSGTSLVALLLDAHSRISVYLESNYYTTFGPDRHRYGDLRRPGNIRRLVRDFHQALRLQGIDPPPIDEILAAMPGSTFEGVLAGWLHLHARKRGKARAGEKTPAHAMYLNDILVGFPDSSVIFVMRDPRDTTYSMRRRFDISLAGATWMWNKTYRALSQASRHVYLVRYENLATDPVKTATEICKFVGESFEHTMLQFYKTIPPQLQAIHKLDVGKLTQPVTNASIGSFQRMPKKDVAYIESACAIGMREMGYAFTTEAVSVPHCSPEHLPFHVFLRDRIRYYGLNSGRWKRGLFRWRNLFRVRTRYLLTLGPLRRRLS